MSSTSEAQKAAQKRYDALNPIQTVRLPLDAVEVLKQAAKDRKDGYRGLLKQIILEWVENNEVQN